MRTLYIYLPGGEFFANFFLQNKHSMCLSLQRARLIPALHFQCTSQYHPLQKEERLAALYFPFLTCASRRQNESSSRELFPCNSFLSSLIDAAFIICKYRNIIILKKIF